MIELLYMAIWVVTLGFGVAVVLAHRPDHAAFNLMGVMVGLAANFILMGFQFIGFLQLIVYIGAIMVLFLFVIMLLNLRQPEEYTLARLSGVQKAGVIGAVVTFGLLVLYMLGGAVAPAEAELVRMVQAPMASANDTPMVELFARELLETWIIPFEVTSLLLLAAVIGAIYIARQRPIIVIDTSTPGKPAGVSAELPRK